MTTITSPRVSINRNNKWVLRTQLLQVVITSLWRWMPKIMRMRATIWAKVLLEEAFKIITLIEIYNWTTNPILYLITLLPLDRASKWTLPKTMVMRQVTSKIRTRISSSFPPIILLQVGMLTQRQQVLKAISRVKVALVMLRVLAWVKAEWAKKAMLYWMHQIQLQIKCLIWIQGPWEAVLMDMDQWALG